MCFLFNIVCFICMSVFSKREARETVCSSESPFSIMPILHHKKRMTPTVKFDRMQNTAY